MRRFSRSLAPSLTYSLLRRRARVLWSCYVAPSSLEREAGFRAVLAGLMNRSLRIIGWTAVAGSIAYLLYRLLAGASFQWIEAMGGEANSVQGWDKLMVVGLGLFLVVLGKFGVGLRQGRAVLAAFLLVVAWLIVLRSFSPGNYNLAAAWLTLLLFVGVTVPPFQPWQVALFGTTVIAEFVYFAFITPGMLGERSQVVFLVLATGIATVVRLSLYVSRHGQHRGTRRLNHNRARLATRYQALEDALARERRMQERENAMREQLAEQEKLASLGHVTAGIAHEIKNPLNFVNNFADLTVELVGELDEELAADPERSTAATREATADLLEDLRENARRIREHGLRADGIVRNMLAHSRISPGDRRPVELNKLLDEYTGLAYHGMRARRGLSVKIERSFDETLGEVSVVPEELGRVFLNLLDNAFDAVNARAQKEDEAYVPIVEVATERLPEVARITVSDNGTGMSPETAERVFEPFFTTKPTGSGTGLGLSLAYEIVTKGHSGTLAVESTPGMGTRFTMTLPLRHEVTGPSTASPEPSA